METRVASAKREVLITGEGPTVLIGERINPSGKKKLARRMPIATANSEIPDIYGKFLFLSIFPVKVFLLETENCLQYANQRRIAESQRQIGEV